MLEGYNVSGFRCHSLCELKLSGLQDVSVKYSPADRLTCAAVLGLKLRPQDQLIAIFQGLQGMRTHSCYGTVEATSGALSDLAPQVRLSETNVCWMVKHETIPIAAYLASNSCGSYPRTTLMQINLYPICNPLYELSMPCSPLSSHLQSHLGCLLLLIPLLQQHHHVPPLRQRAQRRLGH